MEFNAGATFACLFWRILREKVMFGDGWVLTLVLVNALQQLQAAVEKRNEIISQLSVNLQAALTSRDQVQVEAQQLTGQIQELQQQLQQVRNHSAEAYRMILCYIHTTNAKINK